MKKILITMLLVLATSVMTHVQAQIFSNRSAQFKEGYAEGLKRIIQYKSQLRGTQPFLGLTTSCFFYKINYDYVGGVQKVPDEYAASPGIEKWCYFVFDEITFNMNVVNTNEFRANVLFYENQKQNNPDYADYWEGYRTGYELGAQIAVEDLQL